MKNYFLSFGLRFGEDVGLGLDLPDETAVTEGSRVRSGLIRGVDEGCAVKDASGVRSGLSRGVGEGRLEPEGILVGLMLGPTFGGNAFLAGISAS